MPNSTDQNSDIEKDIAALSQAPIQQLRLRWHAMFRTEPPAAFGPDLLRCSIAQKVQEQHYGGLSTSVQRQLSQIVNAMAKKPSGRIELPQRIKSGAVLVRTWKDKSHRVMVLDDGFAFEGRVYNSLSEVARDITGTRWNGPKFFGLRAMKSIGTDSVKEPPRQRGRPPAVRSEPLNSATVVSPDR